MHALSRSSVASLQIGSSGLGWHCFNSSTGFIEPWIEQATFLLHLAPLWVLPQIVAALGDCGLRRLVVVSSTSRFTKENSGSLREQEVARKLIEAEEWLASHCKTAAINWTILRPTMIYGTDRDKTITTIRNFIRRFGFFPLAGKGKGLRQPVHAEDLAQACMDVIGNAATYKRAYNLGGGEVLTFREIVEAIASQEGKRVWLPQLSGFILRLGLQLLRLLPAYRYLDPEMFARAELDQVFELDAATRDFFYSPRPFRQ